MTEIVIRGGYGLSNFGDDALLYYLLKELYQLNPNLAIKLDCSPADYIKTWFADIKFTTPFDSDCELFIYGGGTLFYSFPAGIIKSSFFTRLRRVVANPKILFNRLLYRKRYEKFLASDCHKVMFGVGIGPFYEKNLDFMRAVQQVTCVDEVVVRDSASEDFVKGLSRDVQVGPDICYLPSTTLNYENKSDDGKRRLIGVVVRDWKHGTDADCYPAVLLDHVANLRSEGYKIQFIVFSPLRDKEWLGLLEANKEEALVWNPYADSIETFSTKLKQFDLILSARFHGLVFSTLLEIPSISIVLEPKLALAEENSVSRPWDPVSDNYQDLKHGIDVIFGKYDEYKRRCVGFSKEKQETCQDIFNDTFKELL